MNRSVSPFVLCDLAWSSPLVFAVHPIPSSQKLKAFTPATDLVVSGCCLLAHLQHRIVLVPLGHFRSNFQIMPYRSFTPTMQAEPATEVNRELAELARSQFAASRPAGRLDAECHCGYRSRLADYVFNSGAERMLGYAAEELVGKQTPAILSSRVGIRGARKTLSEKFGRPIKGHEVFVEIARRGETEEREWTFVRKDGSRLIASVSINPGLRRSAATSPALWASLMTSRNAKKPKQSCCC